MVFSFNVMFRLRDRNVDAGVGASHLLGLSVHQIAHFVLEFGLHFTDFAVVLPLHHVHLIMQNIDLLVSLVHRDLDSSHFLFRHLGLLHRNDQLMPGLFLVVVAFLVTLQGFFKLLTQLVLLLRVALGFLLQLFLVDALGPVQLSSSVVEVVL